MHLGLRVCKCYKLKGKQIEELWEIIKKQPHKGMWNMAYRVCSTEIPIAKMSDYSIIIYLHKACDSKGCSSWCAKWAKHERVIKVSYSSADNSGSNPQAQCSNNKQCPMYYFISLKKTLNFKTDSTKLGCTNGVLIRLCRPRFSKLPVVFECPGFIKINGNCPSTT